MRVYFKGVVLGAVAVLVVVMVVQHHSRRHALSVDRNGGAGHTPGSDDRPTHKRRPATKAGRQGAASAAARIQAAGGLSKKASKTRKSSSHSSSSLPQQMPRSSSAPEHVHPAEDESSRPQPGGPGDSPSATTGRLPSEAVPQGTSDQQASRQASSSSAAAAAAAAGPAPGATSDEVVVPGPAVRDVTRDATPAAETSFQSNSEVGKANVSVAAALKTEQLDIRTVDPLSATEPMVMRQQEELDQQRFGFQPWRGRPKPPEKLEDLSKSWLTDLEYPKWYLESVGNSRVYGKAGEFVGGNALFEGPCDGADQVKAQNQANKVQTFSYVEPGQFILGSKNPCWYEDPRRRKQMRCLPYFFVAGVAKCGTTDLYKRVRYHPDIMEGELKEYHWWDRLRYGAPMELKFTKESERNDRPLPLALYSRIIMGDEVEDLKADLRSKNQSEKICGDGSPSYLWDPKEWMIFEGNEGCTEPRIVIGSFIQHANPRARIILLFRQPTQRLYSRFLSRRDSYPPFRGATSRTFHDYVVKGVAMYKACFREHSIRECAYNRTLYDEAVIRIVEGMYSVFVEDWLRIFKRDQILAIRNEDYSEDIEGKIIEVFNFLGVAKLGQSEMRPVLTHVSTNIGQNYKKVGAMLPETIAILNEFYKPFVLRLNELIRRHDNDDRFLWKDIAVT